MDHQSRTTLADDMTSCYSDEDGFTSTTEYIASNQYEPLYSENDTSTTYQSSRKSKYDGIAGQRKKKVPVSQSLSQKPPRGTQIFYDSQTLSTSSDLPDVTQVYQELQEINHKLKKEFAILHERSDSITAREELLHRAEYELDRNVEAKVKRKIQERENQLLQEIEKMDTLLKEKTKENKRLQDNFNTLKSSNDSLKKEMDALQERHEKLEKQSQSVQGRLHNLQRKKEFDERKELNLPQDHNKTKQNSSRKEKHIYPKLKLNTTQEVLSVLLEWVSDFQLRHSISDQPLKQPSCPADLIQENCLKTFPHLVDLLKECTTGRNKIVLPCLQYMYWALLHLEQGKGNQKAALSSTLRRLGEELYRPRLSRGSTDEAAADVFYFHSSNLHIRFLSSLLILKTVSQVDHLAHVFDVLRNDLKLETAKELFIHYQATPLILGNLKPINKTLMNAAIDIHLQMSMESQLLPAFLESCSNEVWFRNVSTVWKSSSTEHKTLEKLSIILQKLSKIKSNRKYFEVFGMINSAQELSRSLGNDQDAAFLNLNLKSVLFNLSVAKGTS